MFYIFIPLKYTHARVSEIAREQKELAKRKAAVIFQNESVYYSQSKQYTENASDLG